MDQIGFRELKELLIDDASVSFYNNFTWAMFIIVLGIMGYVAWVNMRLTSLERQFAKRASSGVWAVVDAGLFDQMRFLRRVKASRMGPEDIPTGHLDQIVPWDVERIVRFASYIKQPQLTMDEIFQQQRILTVSAIIYRFPVPLSLLLVDENTMLLWRIYTTANQAVKCDRDELVSLHQAHSDDPIDQERFEKLFCMTHAVVADLMQYAPKGSWPYYTRFLQEQKDKRGLRPDETASIITGYAAFTQLRLPGSYYRYSELAYWIYNKLDRHPDSLKHCQI
jgi:hypothetical protein